MLPMRPTPPAPDFWDAARRTAGALALAPFGPLGILLAQNQSANPLYVRPSIEPGTGLPVNPVVNDARVIGALMERLGLGRGWQESTEFLDRDPSRDAFRQLGDRLGLLGALMNTTGREVGQPLLGASSVARARYPGIDQASPVGQLLAMADPHPERRELPATLDRDALREFWNEGGYQEGAPGSRFLAEFLTDPANLIFTRGAQNAIGRAGASIGGNRAANMFGRGLELVADMLGGTMDLQDDALRSALRLGGDVAQAVPWINQISKEGQLNEFAARMGDVINALRGARGESFLRPGGKVPAVELDTPPPWVDLPKNPQDWPSIQRAPGQWTPDELVKDALAKNRDDPFGAMIEYERELTESTANNLRSLGTSPRLALGTEVFSHAQAQLTKADLEMEQWHAYLSRAAQEGRMHPDDAAKELLAKRAERLARVMDIHLALNKAIDRAGYLAKVPTGPDEAALAARWSTEMADFADKIADFPQTYHATASEIDRMIAAGGGVPSPLARAVAVGPRYLQDLVNQSRTLGDDVAAIQFDMSAARVKNDIDVWARANGYAGKPITSAQDFKDLLAAIRQPDQTFVDDQIRSVQDQLAQARLDVHAGRARLTDDLLAGSAASPDTIDMARRELFEEFQSELAERLLAQRGGGRYEAFLPDELSDWFRNQGSARRFDEYLHQLVRDQHTLYKTIKEGGDQLGASLTIPDIMATIEDPKAALAWAREHLDANTVLQLERIYNRWGLNPIKEDVWTLIGDRLRRQQAQAIGLDQTPRNDLLSRAMMFLKLGDQVLQEEALASPGTLTTNALGGVLLAALHGSDPARIIRNVIRNAGQVTRAMGQRTASARASTLATADYLPSQLQDLYDELDLEPPGMLTRQTKGSLAAQTGRGRLDPTHIPGVSEPEFATAVERVHPVARAIWGGVEGAGIGSVGGPFGMAAGALLGGLARVKGDPVYKQAAGALYDAVEGALRGTRVLEYWEDNLPALRVKLAEILDQGVRTGPMAGPRVTARQMRGPLASTPEDFMAQADLQDLKPAGDPRAAIQRAIDNGGLMSARQVREEMARQGLSAEDAARVGQLWQDELNKVNLGAVEYSNKVNFDYIRTTNLEEFLRRFVWFPTWPVRFAPLFVEMLVEHPAWLWGIVRFNDMAERANESGDRPPGMAGYLGTGPVGTLLANTIYGRAGYLALNVTRPFAAQAEGLTSLDQTPGPPTAQAIAAMQRLGFGLRPQLQLPLELLGVANESPFGLARSNSVKEALTALIFGRTGAAEGPLLEGRRLMRAALAPLTGASTSESSPTGSPLKDQQIRRRIAELAYEDNGQPPAGPYAEAIAGPSSPEARLIWETARTDIERGGAVSSLLNFSLPVRARYISEDEQRLRGAGNAASDRREQARQSLVQRVMAGELDPQEATRLLYQEIELARRANPTSDALWDTSNSFLDRRSQALDEYRRFLSEIRHLPNSSQRIAIKDYLASRPDIARYVSERTPNSATERFRDARSKNP